MATKDFRRNQTAYPSEIRSNLWPLCCGAAILSGFKDAGSKEDDKLIAEIKEICDESIPDNQVYAGEGIRPKLYWLTLSQGQTDSKKIMNAVTAAGFVKVGEAKPRGTMQTWFVRDKSNTFTTYTVVKGAEKAA